MNGNVSYVALPQRQKRLSRNQRRKQNLLTRGVEIGEKLPAQNPVQTVVVRQNQPPSRGKNSRRRRRRTRSRTSGGASQDSYVKALMHPESSPGAKIPDLVSFPSATFQSELMGVLGTSSTGDACAIQIRPFIMDGSTTNAINVYNGNGVDLLTLSTTVNWPNLTAITANYALVRCVSMSCEVFFTGPSTSDQGSIAGGVQAYEQTMTTYSNFVTLNEVAEGAARNGLKVLYKPLDSGSLQYKPCPMNSTFWLNALNRAGPNIIIALSGLAASTTYFRYHIVANWEAIPKSDSYDFISTSPSPYNQSSLQRAFEWGSRVGNNVMSVIDAVSPFVSTAVRSYQAIEGLGGGTPSLRFSRTRLNAPSVQGYLRDIDLLSSEKSDENNNSTTTTPSSMTYGELQDEVQQLRSALERIRVSNESSVGSSPIQTRSTRPYG